MKIVWIVLGLAGFVFAGFGINQFVDIFSQSDPGSAGGGSRIAAGLLPVLVGTIVCLVGFKKAFEKPKAPTPPENDSEQV